MQIPAGRALQAIDLGAHVPARAARAASELCPWFCRPLRMVPALLVSMPTPGCRRRRIPEACRGGINHAQLHLAAPNNLRLRPTRLSYARAQRRPPTHPVRKPRHQLHPTTPDDARLRPPTTPQHTATSAPVIAFQPRHQLSIAIWLRPGERSHQSDLASAPLAARRGVSMDPLASAHPWAAAAGRRRATSTAMLLPEAEKRAPPHHRLRPHSWGRRWRRCAAISRNNPPVSPRDRRLRGRGQDAVQDAPPARARGGGCRNHLRAHDRCQGVLPAVSPHGIARGGATHPACGSLQSGGDERCRSRKAVQETRASSEGAVQEAARQVRDATRGCLGSGRVEAKHHDCQCKAYDSRFRNIEA